MKVWWSARTQCGGIAQDIGRAPLRLHFLFRHGPIVFDGPREKAVLVPGRGPGMIHARDTRGFALKINLFLLRFYGPRFIIHM